MVKIPQKAPNPGFGGSLPPFCVPLDPYRGGGLLQFLWLVLLPGVPPGGRGQRSINTWGIPGGGPGSSGGLRGRGGSHLSGSPIPAGPRLQLRPLELLSRPPSGFRSSAGKGWGGHSPQKPLSPSSPPEPPSEALTSLEPSQPPLKHPLKSLNPPDANTSLSLSPCKAP